MTVRSWRRLRHSWQLARSLKQLDKAFTEAEVRMWTAKFFDRSFWD